MNQFVLPGWLFFVLLLFLTFFLLKIRVFRRKIEFLKANDLIRNEFSDYADSCLLSLNEGQYKFKDQAAGMLYDDLGSTIAAARLSFEYLMLREYSGTFNENEVFHKAYNYIEDAYTKIRSIDGEAEFKTGLFIDVLSGMAEKASLLSGAKVVVRSFGASDKLNGVSVYLLFFLIRKVLADTVGLCKGASLEIAMFQKTNQVSLIIQTKGVILSSCTVSGLRGVSKNISVFTNATNRETISGSKIVIVVPNI